MLAHIAFRAGNKIKCLGCVYKYLAPNGARHEVCGLRAEPLPIFGRVDEARNHATRVVRLIEHSDPVEKESVRLSSQITKVFHHRVRLMVVLRRDFRALHNLPEHLCPCQRRDRVTPAVFSKVSTYC